MKRTFLGTLAILGLTFCSFGQGEVYFVNTAAPETQIYTNYPYGFPTPTGTGRLAGYDGTLASQWYFALFSAPNDVDSVSGWTPWLDPAWSFTGAYATNTTFAGRITASEPNAHGAVVIPGISAGSAAALNVIGWNAAAGGTTLASFINAWNGAVPGLYYGYSDVAHIPLGNGGLIPDIIIFGLTAGQITGFTVGIPEPTAFALALLCSATVLAFRRVHREQHQSERG